ncbi:MAG: WYL domain-containing protein [Planctomycetota bacterium]
MSAENKSLPGGTRMTSQLRQAMRDHDKYVIEMDYDDARGNRTHRVVSPIRFMGSYRFLGLCLCREQPRQFQLSRCRNIKLVPAEEIQAPVPIESLN